MRRLGWIQMLSVLCWLRRLEKGESVVVYGDYDVDGCTSATLLQRLRA